MNRQGRILVMDDLERWREQLAETLTRGGFHVDTASTAAHALKQLEEGFYHLVVLDVRMDESNPDNIDGITLLNEIKRRGLNQALKMIMLSSYGTTEHMRVTFKDYEVVDFVPKDEFNNIVFLENVRQIFATKVNINLALETHWQQGSAPEQTTLNMEVGGTRLKRHSLLHQRTVQELDDLLCRLFKDAVSILVQPLLPGWSGTRVLQVRPFFSYGGGYPVVVKFGNAEKIQEEYDNFIRYVQPFVGGRRCTTILAVRYTPYLGGIVYSLLGFANDHLEDFGSLYRRAGAAHIQKIIDELFTHTCSSWYANPGVLQPHNLTADYQHLFGYKVERLETINLDLVKFTRGKQKIIFNALDSERQFTNPIHAAAGQTITLPTYVSTTHGDFNQNNIFVDDDGHVWLIDFQGTGRGHILRDVAMLDSAIRFQLLTAEEATLAECLQMEQALNSVVSFSEVHTLVNKFSTRNSALQKAYDTVVHLRVIAYKLVVQNPNNSIGEYYAALFYNALNALRFSSLSQRQREYSLLSASLFADYLGLGK